MKLCQLGVSLAACAGTARLAAQEPPPNTLSPAEKQAGWKLLFDGKTTNGWRTYRASKSGLHWLIEDGCLKNPKGSGRPETGGGELLTTEQFSDFDFRFEWRIAAGGNSGLIYFVKERLKHPGARMFRGDDGTGPVGHEYQLLDDERHPDAQTPSHRAGSLYALITPNAAKRLKPAGQFNESRILVQGKHVEHWLNGAKILEYGLESPALMQLVAGSKYKDLPGFGTKFKTALQIQDHGDEIWFRNLKIRPL
jgi:cytochrome c